MMSDEPIFHANITARYEDSNAEIRFSDFMTKRKGVSATKMAEGILLLSYQMYSDERVREWWDKGVIEHDVAYLRKKFVDSDGKMGISRIGAVRVYKVLFKKLSIEQITKPFTSFDQFTWEKLNQEKKK